MSFKRNEDPNTSLDIGIYHKGSHIYNKYDIIIDFEKKELDFRNALNVHVTHNLWNGWVEAIMEEYDAENAYSIGPQGVYVTVPHPSGFRIPSDVGKFICYYPEISPYEGERGRIIINVDVGWNLLNFSPDYIYGRDELKFIIYGSKV